MVLKNDWLLKRTNKSDIKRSFIKWGQLSIYNHQRPYDSLNGLFTDPPIIAM